MHPAFKPSLKGNSAGGSVAGGEIREKRGDVDGVLGVSHKSALCFETMWRYKLTHLLIFMEDCRPGNKGCHR